MNKVSTRSVARHLLSWLTVIVLLMTAWPLAAQEPDWPGDGQPDPTAKRATQVLGGGQPLPIKGERDILSEGFEAGTMPPSGWTHIQTNPNETWRIETFDPHSGSYYANVLYDPALLDQDEVLLSPTFIPDYGTVSLWSLGSLYWCRDTYDNCDLEVWFVNGNWDGGGGNDVYLGLADDDWPGNWVWSYSTFDFSPYASGNPARIAFRYVGNDGAEIAVDDIAISYTPPAVGPLVYDAHVIDDDNNNNSSGNDDGVVNPGEIIELYVALHNQGGATATGINATISTSDPCVTWLYNTSSNYPDIPGGGTGTNNNDFDFEVDANCPDGHVIHFDLDITASNGGPWSDDFDVTVVGVGGNVALISDQTELQAITPILDSMGLPYDVVNNNWNGTQGLYTSNYGFLSNYGVVVWYASGYDWGRTITQQEHDALEQFLQAGGRLLVTGYDTLGSPPDPLLADLVRSSSSGDGPFTVNYTIIDGDHPITDGPYGWFPAGTALTAASSDHDQAEADAGRGATTVAELAGGRDKIMATALPSGGIVVYWNGNYNASDWTGVLATLREEDVEDKDEVEGGAIDSPLRSPTLSMQPEGVFVVDGILSNTPPPPAPEPTQGEPQAQAGPIPQAITVINFDNASQPCLFMDTVALRNEYQAMGVMFDGPGGNDGGAILNECGNFAVSGHSPPNFLAFNASSTLADGGTPQDPEEITFVNPVSFVQINAGSNSGSGQPVTMDAFSASGSFLGSDTIILNPSLQPLSVSASGIARVIISSPAPVFVLDDLAFDTGGAGGPNEAMLKNTLHWLSGGDYNDDPAHCTPIYFDVPITDPTIDPAGDLDYYCFTGSGGQTIAADIDAQVNGSWLDSVLTLYDSDGTTVLHENDDYNGLDSYLEYPLPHDGTYYLRVREYNHGNEGGPSYTYAILLTDIDQPRPLPFSDDIESGTNGWSADGLWHQVQDGVSPYPNSNSPTHSWWYGQDPTGDYATGVPNSGNLTSPSIAIPPGANATLSFWQWYETEPTLSPQSIYFDIYHGDNNITGGDYSDWADDLTAAGYSVVEYNQPIDLTTLSGHQVLALFLPDTAYTTAEVAAINDFMQNGGRVVALGDHDDLWGTNTILNALSAAHGITFNTNAVMDSTDNDGSDEWPLIYNFADHPLVRGVSTVVLYAGCSLSLSGPAVPLATGDSDTSATAATSGAADSVDEYEVSSYRVTQSRAIIPGAPVVMAYAPVGDGELIAIGDSDLWGNHDPDGDGVISLDEYFNTALSRRMFGEEVDDPSWDQKWVQISVDGGPFQDLLQVTGGPMRAWHQANVDLSAYEDSVVRIRYHFDTIDSLYNHYRGWYIDDVLVSAADVGPVVYHDHDIDDDNNDESSGDGDGIPEAGETIEMHVTLRNDGTAAATNVEACISENSPYVPGFLYNTCADYGDIPGGGTAINAGSAADFDFTIDPGCPNGHAIQFDLAVTADNGGPWFSYFEIHCGSPPPPPEIIYLDHIVDDDNNGQSAGNGDGEVNPGETIELYVVAGNTGGVTAYSVGGDITENSPYVNGFLYNTHSNYGDIPGGGTALNYDDFDFEVDPTTPCGASIPFCMDFSAANGGPWYNRCFDIPVVCPGVTALRVEPPDQNVCQDNPFHVDIEVENVTHLGAFQFDLVYDPAIVQVEDSDDVDLGPFLGSTGCAATEVGPTIDPVAGRVSYGAHVTPPCNGPSGDGLLARVTFHPEALGESDLTLEDGLLYNTDDPPAQITPVGLYHGHVTVEPCFFADVDRDGEVTIGDIFNVAWRWGCQCGHACYDPIYDLNDDCAISISDIQIAACYFGWPNGDFSGCYTPTGTSMSALSDQPATLRLTPEETHAQPGDSFTVDLVVEEARDLAGFEAILHYDPQVLRFDGVVLGDLLSSTGNTAEPREAQVDLDAGTVTLGGFSFGEHASPDGSGTLVTLTFTVQGPGDSPLTLSDVQLTGRCGLAQPAPTVVDGRVGSSWSLYLPIVYK